MKSADQLAALGNELRLKVFRYVIKSGDEGVCAGEIANHFKVPASTLSAHLKTLQQNGLLKTRRSQQRIYYSVNHAQVRKLIQFLVSDCCASSPELCGLEL
ncbi:MAG: ArsR/SmtB family transcription factor [Pseudohongiellaceae bacterium]|jgi:DNA-binding transcriptional ArsR family regulator